MKKLIFIFTLFIYSNLYADFFIESTYTGIVKNFKGIKYMYAVKLFEVNSLINQKCMIYNE